MAEDEPVLPDPGAEATAAAIARRLEQKRAANARHYARKHSKKLIRLEREQAKLQSIRDEYVQALEEIAAMPVFSDPEARSKLDARADEHLTRIDAWMRETAAKIEALLRGEQIDD
jgi:hypothetical protein